MNVCLQLAACFTISIVSNSIYNVDPRSFEGEESDILKAGQSITSPSKRFMIMMMLRTVYPFLKPYLKINFTKPGAVEFFVDLMDKAMKHRESHNIQTGDYLEYLMNLKKKKEISGKIILQFFLSPRFDIIYFIFRH